MDDIRKTIEKYLKPFLLKNNFITHEKFIYKSIKSKCIVKITLDGYTIEFDGMVTYLNKHKLYCLIGFLTYNDLMDKEYKK